MAARDLALLPRVVTRNREAPLTYAEILDALRRGKCDSTADALVREVGIEAKVLADHSWSRTKERAMRSAREFYAEDIARQLADPVAPSPDNMQHLRRFPTVWAVAEVLRTNKLYCADGAAQRRGTERCRKMRAWELRWIREGRSLPSFEPKPEPVTSAHANVGTITLQGAETVARAIRCPLCGFECEDALDLRQHGAMRHESELAQRLLNPSDSVVAMLRAADAMPKVSR